MLGPAWLWARLGAWARRAAAAVLSARHPVPRHIAFIMDGNRRYAQARALHRVEGHSFGYRRLIDALEWCLELGVTCVSVYAFSIDNYRRSGEEVDTLMSLAEEKLAHMLQEHAVLERHGVQVRVIGDLSLAPPAVQEAAQRIMGATRHHSRAILNLCFSYTASEEMLQALDGLAAQQAAPPGGGSGGGSGGSVGFPACGTAPVAAAAAGGGRVGWRSSSLSPATLLPASTCSNLCSTPCCRSGGLAAFEAQLYTRGCPPVDLLVRTSGETRLSDFLLWQSRHALLVFTRVLWPEFGFLDLVAAVMEYQRVAPHLACLRAVADRQATAAAASTAEGAAGAAAQIMAAEPEKAGAPWQRLHQVKLVSHPRQEQQQQQQEQHAGAGTAAGGSPCCVASPPSPSSPSSRSDTSEEAAAAMAAATTAAAAAAATVTAPLVACSSPTTGAPQPLRQRRAAVAAVEGPPELG